MLHHFYLHKCAGCWCRGLISVCSATHATQSQHSGKSCQWYISPLWTDIQHKMVLTVNILILHLTYGRRHCVTKLTSFADRVFTAFRVLTVDQAIWAKKCHHRSCIWLKISPRSLSILSSHCCSSWISQPGPYQPVSQRHSQAIR